MMVTPGPGVAVQDGILHRRDAPPAGQQAGVDVDAAERRRRQQGFAQDVAEGRHHHGVRFEGQDLRGDGLALALAEIDDRQMVLAGGGLDGRGQHLAAAAGAAVGLGDDQLHVEAGLDQGFEARHREIRRSHEHDLHPPPLSLPRTVSARPRPP